MKSLQQSLCPKSYSVATEATSSSSASPCSLIVFLNLQLKHYNLCLKSTPVVLKPSSSSSANTNRTLVVFGLPCSHQILCVLSLSPADTKTTMLVLSQPLYPAQHSYLVVFSVYPHVAIISCLCRQPGGRKSHLCCPHPIPVATTTSR